MNQHEMSGKWTELKGEIKNKWGKLTDDEIEGTKGNLTAISGLVERHYGEAKESSTEKLKSLFSRFGERVEDMGEDAQDWIEQKSDNAKEWMAKTSEKTKESFRDSSHKN